MTFNNRRQSRDKNIIGDIHKTLGENYLCLLDSYSIPLFENSGVNTVLYGDHTNDVKYFFAEKTGIKQFEPQLESITVYRWNKVYPADIYIDIDLSCYKKICSEDFSGNSHDKITKETYIK